MEGEAGGDRPSRGRRGRVVGVVASAAPCDGSRGADTEQAGDQVADGWAGRAAFHRAGGAPGKRERHPPPRARSPRALPAARNFAQT